MQKEREEISSVVRTYPNESWINQSRLWPFVCSSTFLQRESRTIKLSRACGRSKAFFFATFRYTSEISCSLANLSARPRILASIMLVIRIVTFYLSTYMFHRRFSKTVKKKRTQLKYNYREKSNSTLSMTIKFIFASRAL